MQNLYDFWFSNQNLWFNATLDDDIIITELFEYLFTSKIDEIKIGKDKKYGIEIVILYDQISRHLLRAKSDLELYGFKRENFIKETNKISIKNSLKVYFNFKYELNADEYAFVMLPLRHSFDIRQIKYVMYETWERLENEVDETEKNKYKQFLKVTYERSVIQSDDSIYIKKYLGSKVLEIEINEKQKFKELYDKYNIILDTYHNSMLEDTQDIDAESVLKYKENIEKNLIFKFKQNLDKIPKVSFIMSISGGVDSMVCSYILQKMKIPFSCVHINYNNRKESDDEEQFVIEWCKILNIDLYIRKIDEINRPKCMYYNLRELYETYTRDIRYGIYLKVDINPYVILGHNQDDCFENILTNISHKSKYENLNGMDILGPVNFQKNIINFIRPMINISKKEIYEFASVLDIPFLWDSTPKWSQRGKIRDIVRPTLESWNSEMVPGLFEVSKILKESLELVDILVESWKSRLTDNKIICLNREIPESKIFWKKFFQTLDIKSSNGSLDGLIKFILRFKNNKIKLDINAFINYEVNKVIQFKLMKIKTEDIESQKVMFLINKKT
jgi:tRNA(Ile)-lysidine synthetase-like protein